MASNDPRVGDRFEGHAGPLQAQGESSVVIGSRAIRVRGAIPGERLAVELTGLSHGAPVGWGRLLSVLAPATDAARRQPPCPLHEACGGCGLQHLGDDDRLRLVVEGALPTLGAALAATLAPPSEWIRSAAFQWRHKAVLLPSVVNNRVHFGGFARGTHSVVDLAGCLVLAPALLAAQRAATVSLEPLFARGDLRAAPPGSVGDRGLRALVLRGNRAGQVLLTAVVRDGATGDALRGDLRRLVTDQSGVAGTFIQIFDGRGDAVHGAAAPEPIDGLVSLEETIAGVPLPVLPLGFFQVNPSVLEGIVHVLRRRAGAPSSILDAYCGGGALGLAVACGLAPPPRLLGCDTLPASLAAARTCARALRVPARYELGGPEALTFEHPPDLVLLDPPRKGCAPEAIQRVLELRAPRILYVACAAAALGRDAAALMAGGYVPCGLWPADMLPQTPHVEWVAEFELRAG